LNADCPLGEEADQMTLLEVFDVMRNHVTNEIADQALEYLFERFRVYFKLYVFVSLQTH
jgi:hypothetical protein